MNKQILVGGGLTLFAFAILAKDPVIMTVNGEDVPRSEFEYLYHKNSQQQLSPQPLEEYAEMFKIYKLKVADAKAAGIDTTSAFLKEMNQYRRELAQPYLTDSVFLNRLVEDAYERMGEEVETSHIMLAKGRDAESNRRQRERIDSLHAILAAGGNFEELARRYSTDRGSSANGGSMGYIVANRFPYTFEAAAYATPEGTVSEVVESPFGYHIIKTGKRRPARGKVHASHIMKMARANSTPEEKMRAKASIDSIYNLLQADPLRFADLARSESDDPGSARKGGELPWFGPGEMVPEFENMAYSLNDGEISKPFESPFGWHVILKQGHKGLPSIEEVRPEILSRITSPQDGRWILIRDHNRDLLAAKHNARINTQTLGKLRDLASGGIDSVFMEKISEVPVKNLPIIEIGSRKIPVSEYAVTITRLKEQAGPGSEEAIENSVQSFFITQLNKAEQDWLYANNTDYRNLLDEYHDGSLLYEISVRKVWDKAAKDQAGLEDYFRAHKDNYSWTSPHAKGFLVQTQNDSLAEVIRMRMDEIPGDSIIPKIRKEFKGKASIERVLTEKGGNPMVDNILFGGPAVTPSGNYTVYFMYNPRIIDSPEEVNDVRGAVTGDYQNELETLWVEELKNKYPVKVNKKELKKVK